MCDGEGKVEPLDRLLHAIEQFGTAPLELSSFELGERLIRLRHGIDLLELAFAREAAAFAATDEYVAQGSTSAIDWVRHQCGMSVNSAARSIATGEQAERLPASVAALEDGRIGFATWRCSPGPLGRSGARRPRPASTSARSSSSPSRTR